jgi:Cysteine-rich secretory protein family
MQLADKSDDITPTRPLPMQLADKSDDITPTRPLPMQLADNTVDDDAANLATTRDLPLPVEMDQAPLLLEIVDDGEIAKLAPGDYGAVELPDDEEELLFSSSAQDMNDEMVEEVDADEVGTRYLLRGTGDSVTPRSLASDEEEWLIAHNTRRTKLYADNDLGPADLVWSTGLQAKAESYVQILLKLDVCQAQSGLDDWTGGQNLGGARASRKGVVRTKEHALKTWYDNEKDLAFRKNLRYMAVGWRATKYVGCASGKKDFGTGECFIEVCRYIKKANCNVKADNWQAKMLADDSPCGPSCPPEGCLAADSTSEVTTDAKATPAPTKAPTKSPTQAATTAPTKAAADSTAVAVVVPPEATEWLTAHNTRRTALYAANNLSPMDLKWSLKTAEAAKNYLDILLALDGCSIKHYLDDWQGGENLAAAWSGSKGYGRKNTDAVKAWFEGEEKLGFGKNGHYTAVGWRATKYFGCANGKKDHGTGECFIEVCRYVKPGNCNVNADNWKAKMLADDSPCGPECPAEGCF